MRYTRNMNAYTSTRRVAALGWIASGVIAWMLSAGTTVGQQDRNQGGVGTERDMLALQPDELQAMSSEEVALLTRALGLDPAQSAIVWGMVEGANAAVLAVGSVGRDALEEGAQGLNFGASLAAMAKQAEARESIRLRLIEDIKGILDEGQAQRWPLFERDSRRVTLLASQSRNVSSEGIDLTALLDDLDLSEEERAVIATARETYLIELDQAILARQEAIAQAGKVMQEIRGGSAEAGLQAAFLHTHTRRIALRDLNDRHEQAFVRLLSDEKGKKLHEQYMRRAFPGVFAPTRVNRVLEAVDALTDLTVEQRNLIEPARTMYESMIAACNDQLVQIQRASESQVGPAAFRGDADQAGGVRVRSNEQTADLARQKRELEGATLEKIKAILTPAQRAQVNVPGVNWRDQESTAPEVNPQTETTPGNPKAKDDSHSGGG